jgi:hypothetical protein
MAKIKEVNKAAPKHMSNPEVTVNYTKTKKNALGVNTKPQEARRQRR